MENGNVTQSDIEIDSLDLSIEQPLADDAYISETSKRLSLELLDDQNNSGDSISKDSIMMEVFVSQINYNYFNLY